MFAKNRDASTILEGHATYIYGAAGDNVEMKSADADVYNEACCTIAVATENILANANGRYTTFGFVRGLNTDAWEEGQQLWLSSTPGFLTNVKPTYPINAVRVGVVTRKNANVGEIFVAIDKEIRKFGDVTNGNFSGFEDDGTLVFNGNATVYNDLPPNSILHSRLAATNNPTLATFVGNIEQYTFAVGNYIYDNFEIIHDYKEGSNLDIHIHWTSNGVDAADRYVKWEFEYSIANRNGDSPNSFATATVVSTEFLIPANTPTRTHYSVPIGTIDGTNLKIGAVLTYRLRRIASTGTAPSNNPFGLQVGMHMNVDTCGSRSVTTK
jgi:hypothetical protein